MIKSWCIVCEVNMDAGHEVKIIVKANTKRKAEGFAIDTLHKRGYFSIHILSCEEMR